MVFIKVKRVKNEHRLKTEHEEHDVEQRLCMGWGRSKGRKNNVDALNE